MRKHPREFRTVCSAVQYRVLYRPNRTPNTESAVGSHVRPARQSGDCLRGRPFRASPLSVTLFVAYPGFLLRRIRALQPRLARRCAIYVFQAVIAPQNDCAICPLSLSDSLILPVQSKALKTSIAHSTGASDKACAVTNKTGYATNSAGGQGASATGPGIPARGGIAQTGAEARRRACGRYSDPSHAAAYAPGCAILRRKRNHRRSGDAPKCRRRARAMVGSTDPQRQTHRCEKGWSAKRATPKAIS